MNKVEPNPCLLCKGKVQVRLLAGTVIIRCVATDGYRGCGLRIERKGTLDEVIAYWNRKP